MTLKKCSDSKSKVSKVQNSSDIFTLFLPQEKWQISSGRLETCLLIRVRTKNNLYLTPRIIGFDGEVFYSLWQEMEAPQLAVPTHLFDDVILECPPTAKMRELPKGWPFHEVGRSSHDRTKWNRFWSFKANYWNIFMKENKNCDFHYSVLNIHE